MNVELILVDLENDTWNKLLEDYEDARMEYYLSKEEAKADALLGEVIIVPDRKTKKMVAISFVKKLEMIDPFALNKSLNTLYRILITNNLETLTMNETINGFEKIGIERLELNPKFLEKMIWEA